MSVLDILPGGSYLSDAVTTATRKAGFAVDKVKGEVGKVYYGAITATTDAVSKTAKVAQTVTTGIRNYTLLAGLVVGLVLLWPLIAPSIGQLISSPRFRRG